MPFKILHSMHGSVVIGTLLISSEQTVHRNQASYNSGKEQSRNSLKREAPITSMLFNPKTMPISNS